MTDPRRAAWNALNAVLLENRSLDRALEQHVDQVLEPQRRGMAKALCFETLRWRWRLEGYRQQLLDRPLKRRDADIGVLMLLGLVQLEQMGMAEHAVLNETVALAADRRRPWARGLVNAILRRFLRERDVLTPKVMADETARYSYPAWLLDRLKSDWPEHWASLAEAGNQHAPMTLRVNRRRISREQMLSRLAEQSIAASPGLAPWAIHLDQPLPVEQLPGFVEGLLSVQDESAQWAAEWLAPTDGMRVLDACAAPGGKTAALLEQADLELLAIDNQPRRLALVASGLERLGLPTAGTGSSLTTLCADAAEPDQWFEGRPFDRILLDAPCSATGVIRRHPDIKSLRRDSDIAQLAEVQAAILRALWPLLATGGRLLYATCSLCRQENHQQIERFLADTPDAALSPLAPPTHAIVESHGVQCLPGPVAREPVTPESSAEVAGYGDGFFYALLEKH